MNSIKSYAQVAATLFGLLVITVGAAYVNLGPFNTVVAMLISLSKAALIVLFFMHVRRADPLIRLFVAAGFFWLGIMLTLALSDFLTRHY
ncbi:MAG: cytochrome C oxidase subunit IV family protein [Chthoniobacter sp.]|nr:cytochrome C oxidase subunit IV family protein [Chthoniobacter sp.]